MDKTSTQDNTALELSSAQVARFRLLAMAGRPLTQIASDMGLPYMRLRRWATKHGYAVEEVLTTVTWKMPAS